MFFRVEEPSVRPLPDLKLSTVFFGPFRHPGFRSFITYGCFWNFAAMVGAPFITLYLLSHVGMSLFQVLLLWAASWVGGAVLSARLGHITEDYGNRPVLIAATGFKSLNMIALLLVPVEPVFAFWILVPVFMVDAVLNAAISIASNGFMLKNSPAENRSMYIAAGTAIAGMVGGLTSIVCGGVLALTADRSVVVAGRSLNGFHLLFALSLILRWVAVWFARRVEEPEGRPTVQVLVQLIGVTPWRFMRFPVGLYRSRFGEPETNSGDVPQNGSAVPGESAPTAPQPAGTSSRG
jgi:predicted MFS family arabinose efflux permease